MTMTLIQHTELGSSQSSITFSSIPQTFTDLYLVFSLRGSLNNPQIGHFLTFNNDSGANYSSRRLVGTGSAASSASESGSTSIYSGQAPAVTSTGSTFGNTSIYIPNYTSSVAKSVSIEATRETNGTSIFMAIIAGLWSGTAAINRLDLVCEVANWEAYSSATLYGILKGSNGVTVS
jgi:hypothetical protein